MMAANTKARSAELRAIAREIVDREVVDPASPPLDRRALIVAIAEQGKCHPETARRVLRDVLEGKGWDLSNTNWGGKRAGAGRKAPSFKALHGREPISGVDFDPDDICQDTHEYLTGTGQYSDDVQDD